MSILRMIKSKKKKVSKKKGITLTLHISNPARFKGNTSLVITNIMAPYNFLISMIKMRVYDNFHILASQVIKTSILSITKVSRTTILLPRSTELLQLRIKWKTKKNYFFWRIYSTGNLISTSVCWSISCISKRKKLMRVRLIMNFYFSLKN